jgi:pantoate--beta-alanine ligase
MSDVVAFVPTMGALHAGHLELIKRARLLSPNVVLSIFVNPLQFEKSADLDSYPRDLAGDTAKARAAGATKVWAPTYEEVYPEEIVKISAGELGALFEGRERVGHFDGVLTVVNRLFAVVKPSYAIFGEKDFQQLFIVKRWVKENQIPVEIIAVPTVRDGDGLALSSRNARLTPEDRKSALVINRALRASSRDEMVAVLAEEPGFKLDYAEIIDEESFQIADSETRLRRGIVAGWVNGVRLIDNMPLRTEE